MEHGVVHDSGGGDGDVVDHLHPAPAPAGDWEITRDRPELVGPLYSWAAETAGHAMRVIVGGVFDDFPGARLVLGHKGDFLPFHMPRLDRRRRARPCRRAGTR
nr:amidohydrolase family protein [Streptomyces sp. BI87]